MAAEHLPLCMLFFEVSNSWKWPVDGMGEKYEAKTSGLLRVGAVILPGMHPRDPPKQWLATIIDMIVPQSVVFLHSKPIFYLVPQLNIFRSIF